MLLGVEGKTVVADEAAAHLGLGGEVRLKRKGARATQNSHAFTSDVDRHTRRDGGGTNADV